jgi:hypothetical protein
MMRPPEYKTTRAAVPQRAADWTLAGKASAAPLIGEHEKNSFEGRRIVYPDGNPKVLQHTLFTIRRSPQWLVDHRHQTAARNVAPKMQVGRSDADSKVTRTSERLPSEHSEIDSAAFVRQQRSPLLPRQQMSRSVDTNSEMPVAGVAIRQQHQWPYKNTAAKQQQVSAVLPKHLPSGKTLLPPHPIAVSRAD